MGKTLYLNGNVITMNDGQPKADAVLVEDGVILAVGTAAELQAMAEDGQQVDLAGKTMLPGFIDGHSHISQNGLFPKFDAPPIGTTDSVEQLIAQARAYLEKNPVQGDAWFVGMGYDNAAFPDGRHPDRYDLDKISADIPIVMMHASGHVGVCNSKVIEILGTNKDTPNPDGGVIQKDAQTGEPTGMMEELALTQYTLGKMPIPSAEFMMAGFQRSQDMYVSYGITTAQDGSFSKAFQPLLAYFQNNGLMKLDIYGYPLIDSADKDLMVGRKSLEAQYENHVKLAGVKLFLDGSPQAKTAWLTKPYYKVPEGESDDYRAYPVYEDDDKVCGFFKECLTNGWQVLVHCNGDAAMDQFINQYARAQQETGIATDFRPVMVHCQTLREDQLDKMKEIGILPTFFHDHVLYWGDWHLDSVLGPERGRRISPLASAVKRGMTFTLHQDCPVVPANMLLTVHNAVNRKTRSGRDIGPEFAITPIEALRAITIYGAYQCFEENQKGSIEPGKQADFVILDKSPLDVPKEEIKDIKVLQTIKAGTVVYNAE